MKKTNYESIIILVFILIMFIIIGILILTFYNSSSNLNNNNIEIYDKPKTNNNSKNNTNTTPKKTEIVESDLSTFTTTIYDKDENRIHNIKLATEKLNNTILKSNEVFSFNNTIGSMSEKDGYKKATGFDSNGKKIKVSAGGMCQISSTIYNTALLANIEIVERHPHSNRVYYVPVNKDATVYYNTLDLRFKNTLEKDIKILATTDGNNVTISFKTLEEIIS